MLEVLQRFLATPHLLSGPDRRELRTALEQVGDELLVVGFAEIPAGFGP